MKAITLIAAILLIAGGCYFIYDGYEMRQTAGAKIEKEVSSVVKALTDNSVKTSTKVNNESAMKMIGGGVAGIAGVFLLIGSVRRKK
jgi:hypothetical protein